MRERVINGSGYRRAAVKRNNCWYQRRFEKKKKMIRPARIFPAVSDDAVYVWIIILLSCKNNAMFLNRMNPCSYVTYDNNIIIFALSSWRTFARIKVLRFRTHDPEMIVVVFAFTPPVEQRTCSSRLPFRLPFLLRGPFFPVVSHQGPH